MIKLQKINEICQLSGKGDAVAIACGHSSLTWREFQAATENYVRQLSAHRFRRVLFLSENRLELVPLFAACSTLGISLVGADYTLSLEQKLPCARTIGAEALVFAAAFRHEAAQLVARHPMTSLCLDTDLGLQLCDSPGALPPLAVHSFEGISFTSGTTGMPKAAYRTRSFDAKRFADLTALLGFDAQDVFLATIPFYHASVLGWARLFLSLSGKLVLTRVGDIQAMMDDMSKHRVTAMLATPPVVGALVDAWQGEEWACALKFLIAGGKHFPASLKARALAAFGPIVHEYYGTTETGVNAIATPADLLTHPDSCGRLLAGNAALILDDKNNPLPEGAVGRVAICSYQNMDSYLGQANATTVTYQGQTYLVTADIGRLQGNRLFLLNRTFATATGLSNRGTVPSRPGGQSPFCGLNLYALEDRLRGVAGVKDVFAASRRDGSLVVFVARDLPLTESAVATQLAGFTKDLALPAVRVAFVERIPYSPSGKVRIGELNLSA
jgi:acyl-CoA synthetase (AMP-forming)/AMP-acid ligase II